MAQRALEQRVENLEQHRASVEQILPTLATKTDLADLRAELKGDIADLRTELKAELKAESEQTRRHFDVVAEGLRHDIRVVADRVVAANESIANMKARFAEVDARHDAAMRILTRHDRRLTRLEGARKSR